ncbi:fatty acid desaturase family protein [Trichocoleus sp. FACHB-262]|uniref:fatty acid desaturase family protein n=1 Tax=Trichocoleus sp. FACHB-262 TaxID=2692869 RepID=UPI001689BC35|nr:fatty acid desaturase family protein [Trichocoleus sp. FACHB-262]MBD2120940.1 fatty acid desaturase family protein [Trichocoleus sp. FACHB-262]
MSTLDRAISASVPPDASEYAEAWHVKPSPILSVQELLELNERSDRQGWQQLSRHLTVMVASGAIWGWSWGHWWIATPALVVYGFSLASMFAPMHECAHRTAFVSHPVNDAVAWLAGVLSFYNSTFYRRYHKWHHRYTQIPGKDPELEDIPPTNWMNYLWQMSGIPWWMGKGRRHIQTAFGQFEGCPYISETARREVTRSIRWQLAVYGGAIALSIAVQQPWFFIYWLLPLVVGQPILRFVLLAEHTGCTQDGNPLSNTRTTLTMWPMRLLMWNMPFHAEHHLYASIPFHALPKAHEKLAGQFTEVRPGYVAANRHIAARFDEAA